MKNSVVMLAGIFLLGWFHWDSPVFGFEISEIFLCFALLVICLAPMIIWVKTGMRHIPAFEIFCVMHIAYYVNPYLEGSPEFLWYPQSVRLLSGMAVGAFLLAGMTTYYLRQAHIRNSRSVVASSAPRRFLERQLPQGAEAMHFWTMLMIWLAVKTLTMLGFSPLLGSYFATFWALGMACGSISLFYLFLLLGRKTIRGTQARVLIAVMIAGILIGFTSGFLVAGTYFILLALTAYTLGGRQIPVTSIIVCLLVINFLHLGKPEMRSHFWNRPSHEVTAGAINPVEIYAFWVSASWRKLTDEAESGNVSILDRASMVQMLGLVVDETPERRPVLGGTTYWQIPQLFVPRVLWPEKPRGTLPTETLGLYYGVQTEESLNFTSIGFGQIAEGWANFGWAGVLLAGAFFGALFSVAATLSFRAPVNSVGYLLGVVFLASAMDLEHALGGVLVPLTQALILASVGLFFLSSPVGKLHSKPPQLGSPRPVYPHMPLQNR